MRSLLLTAAVAVSLLAAPVLANGYTAVELAPITHAEAQLVVVAQDGKETAYSPAELEQFPTYQLVTTTPWREVAATFEGVLLRDILKAHGLDTAASVVVTAENDYSTSLGNELVNTVNILVATRVNGMPHNRRERGPIQFVIDADTHATSALTSESNFVWMAARIEAGK